MARLVFLIITALLSCQVYSAPVDADHTDATEVNEVFEAAEHKEDGLQGNYFPEDDDQRENELQTLEEDLAKAETAKFIAGAIQAEQKLEAGILSSAAAVAAAGMLPGPPGETEEGRQRRKAAAIEEMEVLEDMVNRDKRAVDLIQGILGGSSGGGDAAASDDGKQGTDSSGSGGSAGSGGVLVSLVSSFLSGSSSSSSSGSAKATDDTTTDDSSGRQFSALGLITSSISTVLRIKFSIFRTLFSFVKGLLVSS